MSQWHKARHEVPLGSTFELSDHSVATSIGWTDEEFPKILYSTPPREEAVELLNKMSWRRAGPEEY